MSMWVNSSAASGSRDFILLRRTWTANPPRHPPMSPQRRAELTDNIAQAVAFWQGSQEWQLQMLVEALAEERLVMNDILAMTSVKHEVSRLQQVHEQGIHHVSVCTYVDAKP